MPIYEYKCISCGKTFELVQSLSASSMQTCIHCHGQVKKLVSASSFQFKGSGWYITDYKRKVKSEEKSETKEKTESKDKKSANV